MRFVDTNVLLYAVSTAPDERPKTEAARRILRDTDLALSVQVLQEFYVQTTRPARKDRLTHVQAVRLIESFLRYPIQESTLALMRGALDCAERFQISYDSVQKLDHGQQQELFATVRANMTRRSTLFLLGVCLASGCKFGGIWKPVEAPGVRLTEEPDGMIAAETSQDGVRIRIIGFWSRQSKFVVELENSRPTEIGLGLPGTTLDDWHVSTFNRDFGPDFVGPGSDSYAKRIAEAGSEQGYLDSLPLSVDAHATVRFLLRFVESPRRQQQADLSLLLKGDEGPLRFSVRFGALRK